MRFSKTFIPTIKEVPADAEIISHRLMIRAGLMRKVASGTYMYLPAGWRVLRKIMQIVREEMDIAGALETTAPMVQPMELWQQTGRDIDYGQTLGKFKDRHGRDNVLSPTAEEVYTCLAANEIQSYKQLPVNFYQINLKYRDEFRPRFGVLRSREFIMKDAYSFDADEAMLDESYRGMYDAYCRIFQRCGVEYVIVQAESGEMGGSGSHQFTVPCENGEDIIVYTEDSAHAWNIEKAPVDPVSLPENRPAVSPPEEVHTPGIGTIEELAKFFKKKPKDMIKTLIYVNHPLTENVKQVSGHLSTHKDGTGKYPAKTHWIKRIAVLVRGDHEVNEEKLRTVIGEPIELADEATVEQVTDAGVGFAGPIGLADRMHLVLIDHAAAAMIAGIAGANRTDYHMRNVVPGRDFPLEGGNVRVVDIRMALEGDTYQGKKLLFKRGIEVGQVFKLGTKYSDKLGARFLDVDGVEKPVLMGCYGIGINRIAASAIELGNDKNGIIWPISIAPWEVIITLAGNDEQIVSAGEKVYGQLREMGVEVLLDDRNLRPGVKFKDADLLGIPVRVTIGNRSIANGQVELKLRRESEIRNVDVADAAKAVVDVVNGLKAELYPSV